MIDHCGKLPQSQLNITNINSTLNVDYSSNSAFFDGNYGKAYSNLRNNCMTCIYSSVCMIVIACLYFIFRPVDSSIQSDIADWWKRGRIVFLFMFTGTCLSVVAILLLSAQVFAYYFVNDDEAFCTGGNK